MNFQDLLTRIKAIDEGNNSDIGGDATDDLISDVEMKDVDTLECGGMMSSMPSGSAPKQSDSVTMNVSMNGSGAGGIRDLMSILKNIEQAGADADDVVFGTDEAKMMARTEEEFANQPDEETAPVSAVTSTGNDLSSKGAEAPKVNGGGNPMQEALAEKLAQHYQSIKEAGEKKTMSRAAKGHEKYGKEGMKALAKAGKEGKDLDKVREKYNKYD